MTHKALSRILILRPDHLGDLAMTLPALRALRQGHPAARIDLLVQPPCLPLAALCPEADGVMAYAPPVFTRPPGRAASAGETLALIGKLRQGRYDLAVDFRGNDLCRLLAWASGARQRIGPAPSPYERARRPRFAALMTEAMPADRLPLAAVDRNLEIARLCGGMEEDAPYRLAISHERAEAVQAARAEMGASGPFAVIHPLASEPSRAWPMERFAAIADHLVHAHGLTVLLSGSQTDAAANERLKTLCRTPRRVVNAAGRFSLPDLPTLLAQARLMVTVDTGPMHLAALVGTPLIALFLPRLAAWHAPYRQPEAAITPFGLDDPRAERLDLPHLLDGISTERVLSAVDRRLSAGIKGNGGESSAGDPHAERNP